MNDGELRNEEVRIHLGLTVNHSIPIDGSGCGTGGSQGLPLGPRLKEPLAATSPTATTIYGNGMVNCQPKMDTNFLIP